MYYLLVGGALSAAFIPPLLGIFGQRGGRRRVEDGQYFLECNHHSAGLLFAAGDGLCPPDRPFTGLPNERRQTRASDSADPDDVSGGLLYGLGRFDGRGPQFLPTVFYSGLRTHLI